MDIFLHETVLNHHSPDYNREIDQRTAKFIWSVPEHKQKCHIQTHDQHGTPLKYPVLWSLTGWRNNVESWRLSKARADAERDASFVFAHNHKLVIKALRREMDIHGDCVNAYAYSKLKKLPITHPFFTEFLRITLITNVNQIP